jgi:2-C-methyl-D-erythritol 4-phosphate cytidylyltransferase/2-C-methyl-D-erythritol 2,4-cyclodiphosphate synthase
MNNFFIILAAGDGARFKKKQKKQYAIYKNFKIFEHSVFKAIKSKLFKKIVLVIDNPKNVKNLYSKDLIILKGGKKDLVPLLLLLNILKNLNQKMY